LNILIAEDEQVIADSYKLFLESRKHKVIVCSDGEQCLRTFDEHANKIAKPISGQSNTTNRESSDKTASPFDLIILDYRMPKKNGLEVAEHILSKVPNQRILLASAYSHELTGSKLSPNIELLHKPFEFNIFVGIVEQGSPSFGSNKTLKRSSTSTSDLTSINVPDNRFTHAGDISDIFRF
jgi:CheY-like chemotaxis protein